jgi:hypothetical protein
MRIKSEFQTLAVAVAMLGIGSGAAKASILTTSEFEATYSGVSVINSYTWNSGSGTTTNGSTQNFLLPQFNTNLGTLLSVTLKFTASSVFNVTMQGDNSNFKAKGTLGVEQIMTAPDSLELFDVTEGTKTPSVSGGGYTVDPSGFLLLGTSTFTANSTKKGLPTPYSAISSVTLTSGVDDISSYQFNGSGGQFTVTYTSLQVFTGTTSNGNYSITGGAKDGSAVSVVYEYDDTPPPSTPEPATMSLMGGALLGLVGLRKRFRK